MTLDELRSLATIERDGYHVFEAPYAQMSVTLEDAEFLYALVKLAQPWRVVEFGSGYGISARFIAQALKRNGTGLLWAIEPDRQYWDALEQMLHGLPAHIAADVGDLVSVRGIVGDPDLVFIDSGYDRRADDIREWLTNGYEGLVVVHDSKRGYDLHGAQGVFLPGIDGMWLGRAA